jgi:Tol biopolymer transport system component
VIPGTEFGHSPFLSWDGEWVGFKRNGALFKVRLDGGRPIPITGDSDVLAGAAWGPDDDIVFVAQVGLWRVSADGGVPERITTLEGGAGELAHLSPHFLPDGKSVLFAVVQRVGGEDPSADPFRFTIEAVRLGTGERFTLGPGLHPSYVDPGFVVYLDGSGSLVAQAFDSDALSITGDQFRVVDGIIDRFGFAEYSLSRTGTLVYKEQGEQAPGRELVIVDRLGSEQVVTSASGLVWPRFSPDGRRIAFHRDSDDGGSDARSPGGGTDIWVWDMLRSVPSRVTFEGNNRFPSWSPDGDRVVFSRLMDGALARAWDGTGSDEPLVGDPGSTASYTPDARWLVWLAPDRDRGGMRIWYKGVDKAGEGQLLIGSQFEEFGPAVSPDGRWIAYVSQDTGDDEVYVSPFPAMNGKVKISVQGGRGPVWSRDGQELFYLDYRNRGAFEEDGPKAMLMAVEVVDVPDGEAFEVGASAPLFPWEGFARIGNGTRYDVHPDGQRFAFVRNVGTPSGADGRAVVVINALSR